MLRVPSLPLIFGYILRYHLQLQIWLGRVGEGSIDINQSFQNLGPGPQPLRFPGFAAQQATQNRTAPIVSGRLQSTKLGLSQ